MRKLTTLLLLASLAAASAPAGLAQSRARRVGQSPAPPATTPAPQQPSSRARPGTAERPADGARDRQFRRRSATTRWCASIHTRDHPVSVLDRDGRFIPR